MQLIQPFGCLIAVERETFAVIAFSENAPEMLELTSLAVPSIEQQEILSIGTDGRAIFHPRSATALQRAAAVDDVSLLNPILVRGKNSSKPFYAVLHRNDAGLMIELEPVQPSDTPVTAAGALKSYKLAAKAISRLQSLPSGNISLLYDVIVREVKELTGYDRVMACKFHEDEHLEVVSECQRSDLKSFLGLHYPATDIPQASRFLLLKNKVRMICDTSAKPVRIIQDESRLPQPLSLCRSTLRACHGQYLQSMGAIASLVLSVVLNGEEEQQSGSKLWGLVVCQHGSPKFLSFPLRYACELLMQVFAVQLSKEVELAAQIKEKHVLKIQTVLCDMLLRDAPVGIFSQSPNVMDLVKCDGAALYYQEQCWRLGITPTEEHIKDLCKWLVGFHGGTSGMITDSLSEAGFPGASFLGDDVCGMAAIRITSKDFILWFRSHDADEGGSGSSRLRSPPFLKAFLEVNKKRSSPWEDVEMNAIHSLQLIVRNSLKEEAEGEGGSLISQGAGELRTVAIELMRLIETAAAPVVAVDSSGKVNGWNVKAEELTGISMEKAIGAPLVNFVEEDSVHVVRKMLSWALQDKEERNVEVKLKNFKSTENAGPIILRVNVCCAHDRQGNVIGICLVAQDITEEKLILDKYARIQGDYISVNRHPNTLIPPIFIANESGICVEWNAPMEKLTGLKRKDAVDKILAGEVFTVKSVGCRVKDCDTLTRLRIVFNGLMAGRDDSEKLQFGFFDANGGCVEVLLSASKRVNADGKVNGVVCFLHTASSKLQRALLLQSVSREEECKKRMAYVRREVRNPFQGLVFLHSLMEATNLTEKQTRVLKSAALCMEQLQKIIDEVDLESIEQCYMEMSDDKFDFVESLEAIVSQGKPESIFNKVPLLLEAPLEACHMKLHGDNLRFQQTLSDFLVNTLHFTPPCEGPVLLRITPRIERIAMSLQIAKFEFRIIHPAPGIPDALIREMFQHRREPSREGLSLYISQKLVKIMGGTVQYLREATTSSFIIILEFPVAEI
ncbi:phytochrome C [Wolffia australiana]